MRKTDAIVENLYKIFKQYYKQTSFEFGVDGHLDGVVITSAENGKIVELTFTEDSVKYRAEIQIADYHDEWYVFDEWRNLSAEWNLVE